MSVAQGAALTIGAVLGTGVISLPAMAAGIAGPASILAWLALVVLSAPLALDLRGPGRAVPGRAVGSRRMRAAPSAAGRPPPSAGSSTSSSPWAPRRPPRFAGGYVADLVGGVADHDDVGGRRHHRRGRGAQLVRRPDLRAGSSWGWPILLAVLLTVATVAALPHADLGHLTPFAPNGWGAIAPAAAVVVWGFAGWEAVTSLTADYRNPARDVPRAAVVAVVVVGVLYLGVVATSILVLGPGVGGSQAPLAELLGVAFGAPGRVITTVVAVLLTVGAMNAYFAGGAKLGAALGRDGSLPAWFAEGGQAGQVPRRALAVTTGLSLAVTPRDGAAPPGPDRVGPPRHRRVHAWSTSSARPRRSGCCLAGRGRGAGRSSPSSASWRCSLVNGSHALWTLAVAAAAVGYETAVSRRRTRDQPTQPLVQPVVGHGAVPHHHALPRAAPSTSSPARRGSSRPATRP